MPEVDGEVLVMQVVEVRIRRQALLFPGDELVKTGVPEGVRRNARAGMPLYGLIMSSERFLYFLMIYG